MSHDIASSIHCYALPYGLIGTISHLLTIYTIIALALHRVPLRPWKSLDPDSHASTVALSVVSIIITLTTTIIAMVRCRREWEFVCLAIWKLSLSIALTGLTGHSSTWVWSEWAVANPEIRTQEEIVLPSARGHGDLWETPTGRFHEVVTKNVAWVDVSKNPLPKYAWWYGVYVLGCVVGMTGLGSLVDQSWGRQAIKRLSIGFVGGTCLVLVLLTICSVVERISPGAKVIGWLFGTRQRAKAYEKSDLYENKGQDVRIVAIYGPKKDPNYPSYLIVKPVIPQPSEADVRECRKKARLHIIRRTGVISLIVVSLIAIFCSDWILAAIAGRTTGTPDGNNAVLYWLYFAAKRLPLFSV